MLSPYDGLSIGILSALKSNGYGTAGQPYPIVTGQDAEVASVKSIIAGEQYSTIYKDTRQLAKVTVKMADAVLKGGKPEVNNTTDYDNGNKVVPSYLLQPVIVYKDNYQKVLVDSGYYTADQLLMRWVTAGPRVPGDATAATRPKSTSKRIGRDRRHPADARDHQDLPRRQGARGRQPVRAPGRDPRDLRRERRRQVDADEGALSGCYPHGTYDGEIVFDGEPCAFSDIRDSEQRGIVIIHQELALCPQLSIAENIFLGNERAARGLIDWNRTNHEAAALLERVGLRENPVTPGDRHRGGQAAARRDREGALQGGPAADPRRADRRAQRRGLRAPARPAARPARRGHHLRDHLAQAERDRRDRRLDHDPARRPDHRDAATCASGEVTEDRIISGMVGRDLRAPIPAARAARSARRCSGSRTGRCTARPSPTASSSPGPTSPCAAARSSAWPG